MILTMLKQAVKNVLHQAAEEWAVEFGLPEEEVAKIRQGRMELADAVARRQLEAVCRADAEAVARLDVEDEPSLLALPPRSQQTDPEEPPTTLTMPAAAQLTTPDNETPAAPRTVPDATAEESDLMAWVHDQRQQKVGWADIAAGAAARGQTVSKDALRMRYKTWRERNGHAVHEESDNPTP